MTLVTRQIVYGTHYLDINADNISSMSVSNQKLLGLYIDAKLNCNTYKGHLCKVHSSIAIILMGKRELIALLNLSSWCLVMVERLFLAVPWGCLQFVIVVFPYHTH